MTVAPAHENKRASEPGASSNVATEVVARAAPDRYALLLIWTENARNGALYSKLNFNFVRDISPVASILRSAAVLMINPSVPTKSVFEFIAYANANPNKVNMATSGIGTEMVR